MKRHTFFTTSLVLFAFSCALSGAHAEIHQNTLTIDATDRDNWAYVNLLAGEVVKVDDAETAMEWDLGCKRTEVILNGGTSGPGEGGAIALKDVAYEDVLEAPEGDYVADTEQIATFARGDGWYTYTGPPNHWVLPNPKVYVLQTADGNFAKLRFIGYYANNEAKEGAAHISIEYALQDDGSRNLVEAASEPTSVDVRQKATTTWAAIKQNRQ